MASHWIWLIFVFAFGSCIGSFLNVVIYRLPKDKSLISPGSACPGCGRAIRFYDNIPLLSWILLGGKCRYCKVHISFRYFVVEFLTSAVFVGLFVVYFVSEFRQGMAPFLPGGWLVYLVHIILLAAFLAASAIDLELWVIPLSICWFVTAVGIIASAGAGFLIEPARIHGYNLFPNASASVGAMTVGAGIGLSLSLFLMSVGVIKRSYESEVAESEEIGSGEPVAGDNFNHRLEVCREIVFLLPVIVFSLAAFLVFKNVEPVKAWWIDISQRPWVAGFLGSLWGYFVGCGVVWATRILGTLGFGKEAMGLGDVHLMGAAGAVVGPVMVVVAFFVAPFFGLLWAGFQMFFRKTRQIPYGPFLSLAVFGVMIFHDMIVRYLALLLYH